MDNTIAIALLVSVIAPVAGGLALGWTQRRGAKQAAALARVDRAEDWDRQDKVAARAEKAAAAIVEANRHTAEVVVTTSNDILHVANQTHELVNSAMTTQKELTLTFAKTTLEALRQNAMANPHAISPERQGEIDAVATKVSELESELEERRRQQKAIDDEKHAAALAAAMSPTIVSFAEPQPVIVQGPAPRTPAEP